MLGNMSHLLLVSSSSARRVLQSRWRARTAWDTGISHTVFIDVFRPRVFGEFGSRLELMRLNGGKYVSSKLLLLPAE